jgi:hypothetical protein
MVMTLVWYNYQIFNLNKCTTMLPLRLILCRKVRPEMERKQTIAATSPAVGNIYSAERDKRHAQRLLSVDLLGVLFH